MLAALYRLFASRLRLSNPWNYKAPTLLAVTYLIGHAQGFGWELSLIAFAWSLCTIVGISAFGYLTNDLGDRRSDALAAKPNALIGMPLWQVGLLLLVFLTLALLPWILFFPTNPLILGLLAAEFLLLVLYMLPPIRLKERAWLGILADALYAHMLPALLAATTYMAMKQAQPTQAWPILLPLLLWQFLLGIRNIILHQLKDADNDRRASSPTWVTRVGEATATHHIASWVVPFEILAWLSFLAIVTPLVPLVLPAFCIFVAIRASRLQLDLSLREWLYAILDPFYQAWYPTLILASLCLYDWHGLILLGIHLLLWRSPLSPWRDRLLAPILPKT